MLEEYLMKVRHEELQAEARKIHLTANIKPKPSAAVMAVMLPVGRLLQSWGKRLEDRYVIDQACNPAHTVDCGLEV
jgi:hypothetical protein